MVVISPLVMLTKAPFVLPAVIAMLLPSSMTLWDFWGPLASGP